MLCAELGTAHRQVLECLKAEEAPLSLWLDVVKAYLAAGHTMHAERMLREGTGAEVRRTAAWMPHPPSQQFYRYYFAYHGLQAAPTAGAPLH